jgi:phage regulator Rha-like protein
VENIEVLESAKEEKKAPVIVIDSRQLAQGVSVDHDTIIKSVLKYLKELSQLGCVAFLYFEDADEFEYEKDETYCLLNQEQTTAILTTLKSSTEIFKFSLKMKDLFANELLEIRDYF